MDRHIPQDYPDGPPPLLTTADVARTLRVSTRTVARLCQQGRLHPVRIGGSLRFRPADVASLTKADEDA